MKYNFFYDETEHSRKINLKTVTAENYYDNFVAVIVGWDAEKESALSERYKAFETKYEYRKSKNELKSTTLKQEQFCNGFASLNKSNIEFLTDFFSLFSEDIFIYFAVFSKIEYVISQIFDEYKNSAFCNMDALKYSIVKAILLYRPQEVIECAFNSPEKLVDSLATFFKERIEKNQENPTLKSSETQAFEEALIILSDAQAPKDINWNYDIAFIGFQKYLAEKDISDYSLIIDKEGEETKESNTLSAAKHIGLINCSEMNSKKSAGVRMADMLAGVISKLLKALTTALRYESGKDALTKHILPKEWFVLNADQLALYKKLNLIICELNDAWYKSFAGRYSDNLIVFISLLKFMDQFPSTKTIKNVEMQGEYFNSYCCEQLSSYFGRLRNNISVEVIPDNDSDFFYNQRGAKIYYDISKQPWIEFKDGSCRHFVLSVGFDKNKIPLITVQKEKNIECLRIPTELSDWACTVVGMANLGMNLFPSEVLFGIKDGKYYADIL